MAFDGAPVTGTWPPSARWGREERLDESPLHLSQLNPAHTNRLAHPPAALEPPLGLADTYQSVE